MDRSGLISLEEMREVFNIVANTKEEKYLKELIREVDSSGDGNLEFEEFSDMMQMILTNQKAKS